MSAAVDPDDLDVAFCVDGCGRPATLERMTGMRDDLPDADAAAGITSSGPGTLEVELVCPPCKAARP